MGFVLNCSGRDNTLIARSKGFGCTVPELGKVRISRSFLPKLTR
ncbi:Uncharacterised protein [Enterobacter hormaechei]|nr:Uncharacterised protein [Enterobacter hormaechei]